MGSLSTKVRMLRIFNFRQFSFRLRPGDSKSKSVKYPEQMETVTLDKNIRLDISVEYNDSSIYPANSYIIIQNLANPKILAVGIFELEKTDISIKLTKDEYRNLLNGEYSLTLCAESPALDKEIIRW